MHSQTKKISHKSHSGTESTVNSEPFEGMGVIMEMHDIYVPDTNKNGIVTYVKQNNSNTKFPQKTGKVFRNKKTLLNDSIQINTNRNGTPLLRFQPKIDTSSNFTIWDTVFFLALGLGLLVLYINNKLSMKKIQSI